MPAPGDITGVGGSYNKFVDTSCPAKIIKRNVSEKRFWFLPILVVMVVTYFKTAFR